MRRRFEDHVPVPGQSMEEGPCKARIVSTSPLVVLSHVHPGDDVCVGAASALGPSFDAHPILHVLALTWTYERDTYADQLARDFEKTAKLLPNSHFLFLTNTEYESYQLSRRGVPSMLASELIFQCERTFHPMSSVRPQFDAVYNARIRDLKRHELMEHIDRALLVYGPVRKQDEPLLEGLRHAHPDWLLLNHASPEGTYRLLSPLEVNIAYNRARVGLCLSHTEGAMRSSMEYLFAGIPVVTTPSFGGRERYLMPPLARTVQPEAGAVAEAVADLATQQLDRKKIRKSALHLVTAERRNFLRGLNRVVQEHFGIRDHFTGFDAFRGDIEAVTIGELRHQVEVTIAGQDATID